MMQVHFGFFRFFLAALICCTVVWPGAVKAQSQQAANNLVLPDRAYTIPFSWQGDTVSAKWEPHTSLLIPVKLKNCPKLFFMQFDTGSPYSVFYKNKLNAIRAMYPDAMQPEEPAGKLVNFSFKAGSMPVLAKEIAVKQFDSSTINWKDKKSIEIIGTLGMDLADGKTVVIDYPGKKLIISSTVPAKLSAGLSMNDFVYAGKRILLPAKITGGGTMLYFDTGSSMYELLTNKQTCSELAAPGSEFIQSMVRSWDRYLTANSIASNASIEINGISIPIHNVTYMEGISSAQAEQMKKAGVGGMTGNKIFTQYILVLDLKNRKFGLTKP